jgi:hypothetical protein
MADQEDLKAYYLEVPERWATIVRVEATTEEEALERARNGEGEWGAFGPEKRLPDEMRVLRTTPCAR